MPKKFSLIYSKIVLGEDDFIGHIAYSIYKQDKILFIEKFRAENAGKEPADADLEQFNAITSMDTFIETYRLKAENILDDFVNTTLSEAVQSIETQARSEQKEILETIIEPITPHGFWGQLGMGTLEHFLATVVFSLVVGFFVLLSFTHSIGFKQTIENVFHVVITPDSTHTSPLKHP